jgi:NAD-dependent deacetylase
LCYRRGGVGGVGVRRFAAAEYTVWKECRSTSSRPLRCERNLPAVWEWFDYRRDFMDGLMPNAAHHAIARWQERFPEFTVVTQNIDGLHQKAGSHDVIELHGNIWRARCVTCHSFYDTSSGAKRPDACGDCGDSLRPDVVLFGEMLPPGAFELRPNALHDVNCVW